MDLLTNPLRVWTVLFGLALPPYALFMVIHEWRGVVLTTCLLVGMAFVLGYEVAMEHGGE